VERRRANLKGALDSARRAQELAPEIGATAFAVGRVLAELGTYKEAIAALSEARRVAPDEVDAYVLEAFLLRESGQEGDALAVLMEAWDRGSRSELLAEQLSLLLLSAGRASAALKIAEDALQEQPNSVPVRFAKGMALVAIPERRSEVDFRLLEPQTQP
jgi:tetratricopeptide (TPR) repeat protein